MSNARTKNRRQQRKLVQKRRKHLINLVVSVAVLMAISIFIVTEANNYYVRASRLGGPDSVFLDFLNLVADPPTGEENVRRNVSLFEKALSAEEFSPSPDCPNIMMRVNMPSKNEGVFFEEAPSYAISVDTMPIYFGDGTNESHEILTLSLKINLVAFLERDKLVTALIIYHEGQHFIDFCMIAQEVYDEGLRGSEFYNVFRNRLNNAMPRNEAYAFSLELYYYMKCCTSARDHTLDGALIRGKTFFDNWNDILYADGKFEQYFVDGNIESHPNWEEWKTFTSNLHVDE